MVSFTVLVPGKCLRLSPGLSTCLLMMCASGRGPATSLWTRGILAGPFPDPDPPLASIEDSFVVQLADLLACIFVKQIPQSTPHFWYSRSRSRRSSSAIRDVMGHKSIKTTERYAHATDQAKRRAVEAAGRKPAKVVRIWPSQAVGE